MNSEYILIKDNKMLAAFCGPKPTGDEYVFVPDNFQFFLPNLDVRNFDADWNLRPLADRIKDGLVVCDSKTEKIVGEQIVALSALERIQSGADSAPKGQKLEVAADGTLSLVPMTIAEQVAAGQMTQTTADTIQAVNVRMERDALLAGSDWTDSTSAQKRLTADVLAKWDTYRQALRDIPQQGGFPWNITWPTSPDGVSS